ncbi:hypothetical protein [Gracilinema caldarium]|uniref:hypothetical protein n=1 Tax=Gracilinema caldarium TaxID=215591 RepID=UPI0026F04DFD|nr:hypothetical protein [Gracilinema caldarium]
MNIPWQTGGKKRFYILSIFFLIILSIGLLFVSRPGVYIMTDEAELFIYGKNRAILQTLKASFSLFRPVIIVSMPSSADLDLQLTSIEKSAPPPGALIVPIRYQPAAEAYSKKHPQVDVILWGQGSASSFVNTFFVDYAADISRAAGIAGPLASKTGLPPAIVFPLSFTEEYRNQLKQAFDEGLLAYGFSQGAVVLEKGNEAGLSLSSMTLFPSDASLQSIVAPIILFSGIRKDLLSKSVIAVFDDSPWPHIAALISGEKRFLSVLNDDL